MRLSHPRSGILTVLCLAVLCAAHTAYCAQNKALFDYGTNIYASGSYAQAAVIFAQAAESAPTDGTLQNLGLAEWQIGQAGKAILAWERALWLNPFNRAAAENLRFARRTNQLESPDLAWYEVVSSWAPANWWAWIAAVSLWGSVGLSTIPGLLRWKKTTWHQALAALGLAVFLLSLPAHVGVNTRSRLGYVLDKEIPLRLTPTSEAQYLTRLAAGEPVRVERKKGKYCYVRANHSAGWIEADKLGLVGS